MNSLPRRWHLALLLLVALALRLWFAAASDLWLDEAFSVVEGSKPFSAILSLDDNTAPLYYLLLHAWMSLLGPSELAVRGLSIVFGLGLVLLLWRAHGPQTAWLAAVLPVLVEFSAETRTYSLFALAAIAHLLLAMSAKDRPVLGFLAGLVTVWAHAYGILYVALAQILALKRKGRAWFAGQTLVAAAWAAWAASKAATLDTTTISWIGKTTMQTVPETVRFLTAGSVLTIAGAVFAAAMIVALVLFARDSRILMWVLIPIGAGLIAGAFIPVFHPKYVLPSVAGLILALRPIDRRLLGALLALGVFAAFSLGIADRSAPWEEIAEAPMAYEPAYAVYPLIYYAAPQCLGELDHVACAAEHGLIPFAGCPTQARVLSMDGALLEGARTWDAVTHSVSVQECR